VVSVRIVAIDGHARPQFAGQRVVKDAPQFDRDPLHNLGDGAPCASPFDPAISSNLLPRSICWLRSLPLPAAAAGTSHSDGPAKCYPLKIAMGTTLARTRSDVVGLDRRGATSSAAARDTAPPA
jgi:hypothetical protein